MKHYLASVTSVVALIANVMAGFSHTSCFPSPTSSGCITCMSHSSSVSEVMRVFYVQVHAASWEICSLPLPM